MNTKIITCLSFPLRRRIALMITVFMLSVFTHNTSSGYKITDPNNKFRVIYIRSCTGYIEYPEASKSGDFVIGVYGEISFYDELEKLTLKKLGNQQVVVKQFDNLSKVEPCQILYIAPDKHTDVATLANKFSGKPVVLITEKEGMAKKGLAALNFVFRDNKLTFEINKSNAEKNGLKVSLQLINIGIEVN